MCLLSGQCGSPDPVLPPGEQCSTSENLVLNASQNGGCAGTICAVRHLSATAVFLLRALTLVQNGHCRAQPLGAPCNASYPPCEEGTYCNANHVCAKYLSVGQPCNVSDYYDPTQDVCAPGLVCVGNPPQCTAIFSAPPNATCQNRDYLPLAPVGVNGTMASIVCMLGLACLNGTCIAPNPNYVGMSCRNDSDCAGGGPMGAFRCVPTCGQPTLTCQPTYTASDLTVGQAYLNYRSCLQRFNCDPNFRPFKGSMVENCAQKFCFSAWKAYIDAVNPNPYTECIN